MGSKSEVVVSGIGGIFPKCLNLDDFIELLLKNKSAEEPAKWIQDGKENTLYNNMPKNRHSHFDGSFFGINRHQIPYFDPLTRLLMELAIEAIIDAGLNPTDVSGRNIPVMIGSTVSESNSSMYREEHPGYSIVGQSRSMTANRISYFLNLKAATYTLDANWMGGLESLAAAVRLIEDGFCEAAIIGCANLSITPVLQHLMRSMGLLCTDGKTAPYTEKADGYSRGDGAVVLFLQRAENAKRNYASLLYADVRFHSDRTRDLFGFESDFFAKFLQECYEKSGVDPNQVSYLETYGSANKVLDKIELDAVEKVFCKNRESPLQIGSVKTNVGHTEPCSAIVSLIKIIVAMETGIIPAHLNFDPKDTRIPALVNGTIEVVNKNKEWKGDIAAINCFGLVTSYGHVIVRRNQQQKQSPITDLPLLINYSTRNEEEIIKINEKVLMQPADLSYNRLVNDAFSSEITGHLYRGYTCRASKERQGFKHSSGLKPPIWYVYSGMGSQWNTMGRDLMKIPTFARSIEKCHNTLKPKGVDLLRIITDDDPKIFENIVNSFIGIAAVQIGLTDVLESIGVAPDGMIGHSVGELGCAYADKCLTAEQMILSAYYRGIASLEANLVAGLMAAIGIGYSELKKTCPESIAIACHNSAESSTISGLAEDVKKYVEVLQSTGVFAKLVNVSNIPYHSKYVRPAAPLLLAYLKKVIPSPKERSNKWVCTSIPKDLWESDLAKTVSPEYLTNNLLSSVYFEEGLTNIPNNAVLIEIAPHGLLQSILKRAMSEEAVSISLTKKEMNCLEYLFNSLGELYCSGVNFNVSPLYPDISFPVPRGTRSLCNLIGWNHTDEWMIPGFDVGFETNVRTFVLDSKEIFNLNYNKVDNRIFVPFAVYFGYVVDFINKDNNVKIITFEDIIIENQIEMDPHETTVVTIMYQQGSGHFEIYSAAEDQCQNVLSGTVKINENLKLPTTSVKNNEKIPVIEAQSFYKEMKIKGYDYPDEYKLVSAVNLQENSLKASIQHTEDIKAFLSSVLQIHLFNKCQTTSHLLLNKYFRQIHVKLEDFKNTKQDYSLWYNDTTNILNSDCGIHVTGIEYEAIEPLYIPVRIENQTFAAFFEKTKQDITHGVNMITEIVVENTSQEVHVITELKEKHSIKYLPHIQDYFLKRNIITETREINDVDSNLLQKSSLLIVSGYFLNNIQQIIPQINNYVLLCLCKTQSVTLPKDFITVAHFSTKNNEFFLVKQKTITLVDVFNIKNNRISYDDIKDISWTAKLRDTENEGKRLYVACRTLPVEGIEKFVEKMQNFANEGQKFRFLFILDSEAPECKPESQFYKRIFEQDSIIQVLNNGTWGKFIDISEVAVQNGYSDILNCIVSSSDISTFCEPEYFGLHLKDLTRTSSNNIIPCEIGALDFSGIDDNGHKIMGFGQFDSQQNEFKTDPEFVWPMPSDWSLNDAATVPYTYTLAYYSLFVVADRNPNDSIFVHGGATEVGFAALYLAYNYGNTVYTTVETSVQRNYLKKLMPNLEDENIMDSSCADYTKTIKEYTKGHGVQIIINCLSGIDHIEACKSVLAKFGRFIQLGTNDLKQYNSTGMCIFQTSVSFHGVDGQHLLQLPSDIKHQLHKFIVDGMENMRIEPITSRLFEENQLEQGLRYLRKSSSLGAVVTPVNNVNRNKLKVNNHIQAAKTQGSYLVCADSSDAWLLLIDWLLENGAKQILITNLSNQNHNFIRRYVQAVKHRYSANINISEYNANTSKNIKNVANDINKLGELNEAFVFTLSEDTDNVNVVENIDRALKECKYPGRIVCFLGTNKEKSFSRKSGQAICNIAWNSMRSLRTIIKQLDVILKTNSTNIFLKADSLEIETKMDYSETEVILPSSLRNLKQLSHSRLGSAKMIELSSNHDRLSHEIPPVFLVPSLSGPYSSDLRKFVAQLMIPVFCVSLPASGIEDDVAKTLTEEIIKIDSSKLYRIIGISWGSILALEIAKTLESLGHNVELYLIDGTPHIIQNFTRRFCTNGEFSLTLLKELIKIDKESIKNILSSPDLPQIDCKDIFASLTVLKNYIEYSNSYKPLQNKIRGSVEVILPETTPVENIALKEHCKQFRYRTVKTKSRNILQNKDTIDYFNSNLCL